MLIDPARAVKFAVLPSPEGTTHGYEVVVGRVLGAVDLLDCVSDQGRYRSIDRSVPQPPAVFPLMVAWRLDVPRTETW